MERSEAIVIPTTRLADLGGPAGCVALTFDDGPLSPWTDQVLDLLERTGAPATFFVLGVQIAGREALLRRMVELGCAVEVHAWEHLRMTGQSRDELRRDVDRTRDLITAVTGRAPRFLRPPEGYVDARVLDDIRDTGLIPVFWSAHAADWTRPGTAVIAERIIAGIGDGAILLLHDAGGDRSETVGAVPAVLEAVRARGLRLISLDEVPAGTPT
jgi:peptidoglycan/xylan/chitin deacetylase (PgdA/CDA1 family)